MSGSIMGAPESDCEECEVVKALDAQVEHLKKRVADLEGHTHVVGIRPSGSGSRGTYIQEHRTGVPDFRLKNDAD